MSELLKRGDRVRHASRTEWGVGAVLADQKATTVDILFENVGAKTFDTTSPAAVFERIEPGIETDYLDSLVKYHYEQSMTKTQGAPQSKKVPVQSWSKAVERFLDRFPGGFLDPEYSGSAKGERLDKDAASALMAALLREGEFRALLARADYDGIRDRACKVVNRSGMLHTFENIKLSNALESHENRKAFAESLCELLYGEAEPATRFESFARTLEEIGAAGWPLATYFPFMRYPDRAMFMRPMLTERAAGTLGLALNYKPELNVLTWTCLHELATQVFKKLSSEARPQLRPRDMIDIQSFLWVSDPRYTP